MHEMSCSKSTTTRTGFPNSSMLARVWQRRPSLHDKCWTRQHNSTTPEQQRIHEGLKILMEYAAIQRAEISARRRIWQNTDPRGSQS